MEALTVTELRGVQLDVLREIDTFCRQHEITYYLAWGTLLGAVRHKGYIPWDDDVDLMMSRPDYRRFCATFSSAGDDPSYEVGAPEITRGWAYPFAKVHDRRTIIEEDTELRHSLGVNVDIFPVDRYARGRITQRWQLFKIRVYKALLTLKGLVPNTERATHKTTIIKASKPVVRRIPTSFLVKGMSRASSAHERGTSSRVGVLVGPGFWSVDEAALGRGVDVNFEGERYPAPTEWDAVLTATYGKYMELPPEDQRQTHHRFVARWVDAPGGA